MTIDITRPGKYGLSVTSPVMPAAGTFGFGDAYKRLINFDKLGAMVTNPVTLEPWSPANGPRVVPLDAGTLVHTGLPNPGVSKVIRQYRELWLKMPMPVIVHLVATTPDHVSKGAERLGAEESVDGIELGLDDNLTWEDAERLVRAAVEKTQKPIIARLPMTRAYELAEVAADAGAGAVVVAGPPRGIARDPLTGSLTSGRIYGPLVKPMALRMVAQLRETLPDDLPIIGAGGIHSYDDARDFLLGGAVAVQVDSVTWVQPKIMERIARDLGGALVTRDSEAMPDEWHEDMGDTEFHDLFGEDDSAPEADQGA